MSCTRLFGKTQNENIALINHGDYIPIDEEASTTGATGEVCLIKVREMRWFCFTSRLPVGEYATFGNGRPSQLPSSVNVLLWGGLAGYTEELDQRQSNEVKLSSFILVFFLLFVVCGMSVNGILVWFNASLIPLLTWYDLYYVVYIVDKRFDTIMEHIVSTKLGPIFRSCAHCDLRYICGRGNGTSYAYFAIKKLPIDDKSMISSETLLPLMSLEDDHKPLSSFGISYTAVPANEVFVPLFGTKHFTRGLDMSSPPKQLHLNMFVWGMILESFQKVGKSPNKGLTVQRAIINLVMAVIILFILAMVIALSFNRFCIVLTLLTVFGLHHNLSWTIAMMIEPYSSTDRLHEDYKHAFDEISSIIEQNSMYHVEYIITNNGRGGQLVFRLKQQQQQYTIGTSTTTISSGILCRRRC